MVVWSWIRSLVSLLLVLGCLLTSLITAGVAAGGAMLIVFCWIVCLILAGGFVSVPGPFQTVQRADLWGGEGHSCSSVFMTQFMWGFDNLGVVGHVGRLLNSHHGSTLLELVTDGDLLVLIVRMLHLRDHDTVRITEVQGLVLDGWSGS